MTTGKGLRSRRLTRGDRALIIPMDHGISGGPAAGLRNMPETIRQVGEGGATGVLFHKGLFPEYYEADVAMGALLHISASTALNPDPNDKVLVATVEEAVSLGADGVSIHVNFGSPTESRQVAQAGRVGGECERYGMPFLFMAYPRGPGVKNPHDPTLVAHVARAAAELGADLVKVPYTGDRDSFARVVEGCPVPVLIAGGPRVGTDAELLQMVYDAMQAGAAGASIGRNVFQAEDPTAMTRALAAIIFEGVDIKRAEGILRGGS